MLIRSFTSVAAGLALSKTTHYILDWSAKYDYKFLTFAAGINNLTNNMYFTRRAITYPGPGIIPADGRNMYLSVGIQL